MGDEEASGLPIPNVWPVMIVSAAVIYPLSYAFARRDLDRPTRLADAISAAIHEPNRPSGPGYPILGRAVLTVILVFGTLVAVFLLIAALQSVAPERYADITSRVPMVFVVAFLLAWIGLTVGLWGLTMRFIRWLS